MKNNIASPWAIQVDQLYKTYKMGEHTLEVLRGLSFCVSKGECVAITGESGSGKSTLLHILGTLDSPTKGHILIEGTDPFATKDRSISHFRNQHIGFVFQQNNLLPEFTALENVMMPGLIAGRPYEIVQNQAQEWLQRMGLLNRLQHYPGQLSGGEQQRVAIARALINAPLLLLADEPSGSLDSANASNIHALFKELSTLKQTTILVVTHNPEFAASLPRQIEIRDGQVIGDRHAC